MWRLILVFCSTYVKDKSGVIRLGRKTYRPATAGRLRRSL
jgi:hypothetical protein